MVDIIIFAYNHELFIREAVTSVINQQADFKFTINILYTKSIDNTEYIINEIVKEQSGITKITLEKTSSFAENVYNSITLFKNKYIIFMDGDDYWTYPNKLSKTVTFLEQNAEYSGVFHDVSIINDFPLEQNEQFNYYSQFKSFSQFNTYREDYFPWDAVNRLIIPPGSLLLRTEKLKENLKDMLLVEYSGGWMMTLFILRNSKFKYINEQWSVYRNHSKGITKTKSHNLFVDSNITILKKIQKDDYYRNIKWDIYKSIVQEYEFLLSSSSSKNKPKRIKLKWTLNIFYHQLKIFFIRINNIMKNNI